MSQPSDPAARAIQRIRKRHIAGPDGLCVEDGQTWPCNTMADTDGDPTDDNVAVAINRVRTALAAAEAQKPATVAEFKQLLRDAIDPPPPPPPVEPPPSDPPPGSTGPGKEPAVPRPVR